MNATASTGSINHRWRLLGIGLAVLPAFLAVLCYGDYSIGPIEMARCLLHLPTASPDAQWVLFDLRLPRVLIAWLVGAALGLAGAILQALTRNSLAEPGLMGVSAGASVAAVAVFSFWPLAHPLILSAAAFGGAMTAMVLLFMLGLLGGRTAQRMLLTGVAISALLGAVTNLLLLYSRGLSFEHVSFWLAGGLTGKSWPQLWPLCFLMMVLLPLALILAWDLNAVASGEQIAVALGVPLRGRQALLLTLCAALTAISVATVGPISFVGIVAPNAARQLVGAWQSRLLPVSALLGGFLVALADIVGRALCRGVEIPCGLVTAAIGGVYLYFLLALTSRAKGLR